MAGVPPNEPKWYIGELIEEITVEGEPRNIVHRNVKVLYANSPEEAYGLARDLGKEAENLHLNSDRKLVRTRFWRLAELNVAQDDSKIGAALFYEEHIGVRGEKTHPWVLPKTSLNPPLSLGSNAKQASSKPVPAS